MSNKFIFNNKNFQHFEPLRATNQLEENLTRSEC